MKAYRRGEAICSWPPDEITTLWWFGAGTIPSWWYGGLWRQYRYRGAHRGNVFSRRVDDIAAEIAAEPSPSLTPIGRSGPFTIMSNGRLYWCPTVFLAIPERQDQAYLTLTPAGGVASLPALFPEPSV